MKRMTPEQMATIYWIYRRKAAIFDVERVIEAFKDAPNTHSYWKSVLRCLIAMQ